MIVNNTTRKETNLYIKLICKNPDFFGTKQSDEEMLRTTSESKEASSKLEEKVSQTKKNPAAAKITPLLNQNIDKEDGLKEEIEKNLKRGTIKK